MYTAKVKFETVVDAQKFVGICNDMKFKVELHSGPYVIDAKSIMGIFSLDFSKPIELCAHCDNGGDFADKIAPYLLQE
ncbi:MAG: HPr family phosphocarrier protein [Clostridiales bacterium]|jgi:phosphocarrier protein HPr|nr:HPr family phosphocarrier protein [Clostridiales bacterium]